MRNCPFVSKPEYAKEGTVKVYSAIVAIDRVEKYLQHCIESILVQTYNDFELILVDDRSPDSSPAICNEYAKKGKHNE